MLETLGCDEALDARGLCVRLGALLLGRDFTADDEFADLSRKKLGMSAGVFF